MARALKYTSLIAGCLLLLGLALVWEDYFSPVSFVDVPAARATLIHQIPSYQTIDDLKRRFRGASWKVIEDDPGPADGRPPFEIYVAEVAPFSDLGRPGALRFRFFNDRLMGTWFFPSDSTTYIEGLKNSGLSFNEAGEATIAPYTRIRIANDHKGNRYVAWEDARLTDELNKWIKRHS